MKALFRGPGALVPRHPCAGAAPNAGKCKVLMMTIWNQITAEFFGRRIFGSCLIEGGILRVKTPYGEKQAALGGCNSDWLAVRLLRELAVQGKA